MVGSFKWSDDRENSLANTTNNSIEIDSSTNAFVPMVADGTLATNVSATTTFHTDAGIVSVNVDKPQYTPALLYDASSDNYDQDLMTFLAKPIVAQSGSFTTTDTVSSFAAVAAHVPFRTPLYANKLSGFTGIRFDLVIRLVVNATRFQAGRYMVLWNPYGGTNPGLKFASMKNSRIFNLTQRTTMPHAEIDVSCDTEVEFVIPFSNSLNYMPVLMFSAGNDYGGTGEVQIFPYSALNAVAGALTCSYTMYYSMRNVKLFGAAVPQSGNFSAKRKSKNSTNVEQQKAGMGPISGALTTVSQAMNILSDVPLISSYARTTTWFTERLARTAEIFGFSKPVNLEHPGRMTKNILHYIGSADGPDQSQPLSLSYKNELGHMAADSPTDLDELDFKFLATIPAFTNTVSWGSASPVGNALITIPVTPNYGTRGDLINLVTLQTDPPCAFVSKFFKLWRGSMVYKFKFVRTEFHSGRIGVTFNPFNNEMTAGTAGSYLEQNYLHREIIDIREHTEVVITVPYISPNPYSQVTPRSTATGIGILALTVIDALVAPSTVSSTIQILVEVAAGPDMEFAVPTNFNPQAMMNVVPQSGDFRSGNSNDSMCNILVKTLGSMTVKDDGNISSLLCIGEKMSSFRTLLKKPQFLTEYNGTLNTQMTAVTPFLVPVKSLNGIGVSNADVNSDLYGYLATCYLYSRGGMRIKFFDEAPTVGKQVITFMETSSPTVAITALYAGRALTYSGVAYPLFLKGLTPMTVTLPEGDSEVQVPHYYQFPVRVNVDCMSNTLFPYSTENGTYFRQHAPDVYIYRTYSDPAVLSSPRVFRSMSDDGNLSYFLSFGPYIGSIIDV